jgi:hypothetical protein
MQAELCVRLCLCGGEIGVRRSSQPRHGRRYVMRQDAILANPTKTVDARATTLGTNPWAAMCGRMKCC